ncbi:MAG: sigma-70 family RNA polymerase sigma factor [Planctomycetes bacterium]|nr:sigma-70 family RNA polymerase sigma factor [Planctomycetota bacterium]
MNDDASNARVHIEELLAHSSWVRALATNLVADAATADDVVQETWLAALKHPPKGGQPVRPWLGRVVRNFAKQWRRGERRREAREADTAPTSRAVPSPDVLVERIETQRLLAGLVVALDEPYRTTVILRYDEGLTAAEIAKRQGIPAGTVRWRLKVGLDALRAKLDERHGGDRRAWCALLLPLAVREPARTSVVAALGKGVLAMNAFGKSLVAALVLGVIVLLLFVAGIVPRSLVPFGRTAEQPVAVTFRPMASSSAPATARELAAGPATPAPARATEAMADTKPTERAPAAVAHVEARLVDEAGIPIRGVVVRADPEPAIAGATSGDGGRVAFDLTPPIDPWNATFRASRVGRATRTVDASLRTGRTTWLGDVVLGPGGALSGRVVDASGGGISDARVFLGEVDAPKEALEDRRRIADAGQEGGPVATTAVDGTFVLDGAPAGFVRVWASANGWTPGYTPPIEVREAQESAGVEIMLEKASADGFIDGIVVAPDDSPIAYAPMTFHYRSMFGGSGSGSFDAGADGRFRLRLSRIEPHDLTAGDPTGVFATVAVHGVAPGTHDLVLRLTEPRTVDLEVHDRDGAPVERYSVATFNPDHTALFHANPPTHHAVGRDRVRLLAERFIVEIDADGFELGTLGPFEPDSVPAPLSCVLERVPGVRGVVIAGGSPVADATVALYEAANERVEHNGFPVRMQPQAAVSARTGRDGRFVLTLRKDGRFFLRAEAAGFAPSEIGPLALDHRVGSRDLEIGLDAGGAIEGLVKAAAPRRAEGTIVGISRGDGHAVTQRVGPDGRFRFDRLTPGRFLVAPRESEIVDSRTETRTSSGTAPEPPTNCLVERGQTTRFDIDLGGSAEGRRRIRGLLTIDGRAPAGWKAMCIPARRDVIESSVRDVIDGSASSAMLDPHGEFTLEGVPSEACRLLVAGPAEEANGMRILDSIDASSADATWRLDLRMGRLEGDAPPASAASFPAFIHVWVRGETLFCLTPVQPDANGHFSIARVPAGRGRIVRFDPQTATDDPREWPTVAEVDVPVAGVATVTLR